MRMDTGDIVMQEAIDKMTAQERKRYTRLSPAEYEQVKDLNRHERRKAVAEGRRAKHDVSRRTP